VHKVDARIVKTIKSWPEAATLSDKDVQAVASLVIESSVPAGWSFIREGTPGDAAYLITDGTAEIIVGGKKVAEIGPGDVTGEIALASGGLRTATVTAQTRCTFLHLGREEFDKLAKKSPAAHAAFVKYVEERVKALSL
jgi:CRP/FNR family transcriptional regulator, cyclic AMP receptor protein